MAISKQNLNIILASVDRFI